MVAQVVLVSRMIDRAGLLLLLLLIVPLWAIPKQLDGAGELAAEFEWAQVGNAFAH